MAPDIISLTLQQKITRRLILQQARHHTINCALTGCKLTVSGSISLSFSLFFSPFHHCTRSLSVTGRIQTGFHVPRLTRDTYLRLFIVVYEAITLYGATSQLALTNK